MHHTEPSSSQNPSSPDEDKKDTPILSTRFVLTPQQTDSDTPIQSTRFISTTTTRSETPIQSTRFISTTTTRPEFQKVSPPHVSRESPIFLKPYVKSHLLRTSNTSLTPINSHEGTPAIPLPEHIQDEYIQEDDDIDERCPILNHSNTRSPFVLNRESQYYFEWTDDSTNSCARWKSGESQASSILPKSVISHSQSLSYINSVTSETPLIAPRGNSGTPITILKEIPEKGPEKVASLFQQYFLPTFTQVDPKLTPVPSDDSGMNSRASSNRDMVVPPDFGAQSLVPNIADAVRRVEFDVCSRASGGTTPGRPLDLRPVTPQVEFQVHEPRGPAYIEVLGALPKIKSTKSCMERVDDIFDRVKTLCKYPVYGQCSSICLIEDFEDEQLLHPDNDIYANGLLNVQTVSPVPTTHGHKKTLCIDPHGRSTIFKYSNSSSSYNTNGFNSHRSLPTSQNATPKHSARETGRLETQLRHTIAAPKFDVPNLSGLVQHHGYLSSRISRPIRYGAQSVLVTSEGALLEVQEDGSQKNQMNSSILEGGFRHASLIMAFNSEVSRHDNHFSHDSHTVMRQARRIFERMETISSESKSSDDSRGLKKLHESAVNFLAYLKINPNGGTDKISSLWTPWKISNFVFLIIAIIINVWMLYRNLFAIFPSFFGIEDTVIIKHDLFRGSVYNAINESTGMSLQHCTFFIVVWEILGLNFLGLLAVFQILSFKFRKGYPSYNAVMDLTMYSLPTLSAFSSLKMLRTVHPNLILTNLRDSIKEPIFGEGTAGRLIQLSMFLSYAIVAAWIGTLSFVVKVVEATVMLSYLDANRFLSLCYVFGFLNQCLGIVMIDQVLHNRVMLFIFGGETVDISHDERVMRKVYIARCAKSLCDTYLKKDSSMIERMRGITILCTFNHRDIQKLILNEDWLAKDNIERDLFDYIEEEDLYKDDHRHDKFGLATPFI